MKKLLSLFMITLMVCGCSLKTEYNMVIKEDKSMDFSIITAMDEELINAMMSMQEDDEQNEGETVEYTDEQIWEMLEDSNESEEDPESYGFTKERYESDQYKGFKYTTTIPNIDYISGGNSNFDLGDFQALKDAVLFEKKGNKYKANFVLSSENQDTQGYNIGIEMIFKVTLPNEPISHNATEVSEDGKTLTWNLMEKGTKNIEFEFELEEGNNLLLYGGIAGLILIIAVVVIISSKKKKGNSQPQAPVQPSVQQPQVPVQPSVQQPQVPVQPSVQQPQAPVQPSVQQPQVPVQPSMQQPQAPVQPSVQQPQAPVQPSVQQPQVPNNNQ